MTEQELAKQLFTHEQELSSSAASIMTGTALGDSSDGNVRIQVDGAQVGGDNQGIILPTTTPVSSGQKVVITLYGRSGGGKKGMVTGIVGGSGGGGGDISQLEARVSALESDMTTAQSDISTLKSTATTHTSKINELVTVANKRGFIRLYTWTGTGTMSSCKASFWYQPMSGLVVVPVYVSGTPGTGWLSIGSGIPTALRPGQLTGATDVNYAQAMFSQSIGGYVSGGGYVGVRSSYSGATTERGYVVYLTNADENYTSTISTVSSSISPLTITRAYAARVALGDGLDVQSDEFEKTAPIYDEAYSVIFGDDNTSEESE